MPDFLRCAKCKCDTRFIKMPEGTKTLLCRDCDPAAQALAERRLREKERADQIERDIAAGRREAWSGRILPRFED